MSFPLYQQKNFAIFSQVSSSANSIKGPLIMVSGYRSLSSSTRHNVFYLVLLLAHELFKFTALKFNFSSVESEEKSYASGGANTALI